MHPITRKWLSGRCGCPTGGDGLCKHAYALVYTINHERTEACTDQGSQWSKPSQAVQDLYPKGLTAEELYTGKYTPRSSTVPTEDKLKEIAAELAKFGLTESSLYKTVSADATEQMEVDVPPPTPSDTISKMFQAREIETPLVSGFDLGQLQDPMKQFYQQNIIVAEANRYVDIFQRTLSQSDCEIWFLERGSRISSSQAKNIYTSKKSHTCLNYFKKKKISHPNLDYGIANEENARLKYSEVTGYSVERCGLVISHTYNWLCGSPDGVVQNAAGERLLLEIKCPKNCEGAKISVPWVKDSKLKMVNSKQGAEYYCQVQLLMFLCRAKKCHFFIWSEVDYLLLEIELNESYL